MKIILGCFLALISLHPLHISVTEIKYDEKEKELETMCRIFVDDLETAMRERTKNQDLDILNPKGTTVDQLMAPYFTENLKVTLDGKIQPIQYLGHEKEGEAFIFYVGVPKVKKWKTIQVTNTVLLEMFDDQSNLVHVTVRDDVQSMRLTKDKSTDKLTFQY